MAVKIRAIVDTELQAKEKNIAHTDYPMFNYETGRRLKKTFSHYYSSWDEYWEKNSEIHGFPREQF